jgi:hypothetical protein
MAMQRFHAYSQLPDSAFFNPDEVAGIAELQKIFHNEQRVFTFNSEALLGYELHGLGLRIPPQAPRVNGRAPKFAASLPYFRRQLKPGRARRTEQSAKVPGSAGLHHSSLSPNQVHPTLAGLRDRSAVAPMLDTVVL